MKENIIKTYSCKNSIFKDFPKKQSYSIKDIFVDHWSDFCKYAEDNNLIIRDIVYFEVAKMMKCKTPQLGFSFYECPELKRVVIPPSVQNIEGNSFFPFDGIIVCKEGSAAEIYAINCNIDVEHY